jgi:hypothetical protein
MINLVARPSTGSSSSAMRGTMASTTAYRRPAGLGSDLVSRHVKPPDPTRLRVACMCRVRELGEKAPPRRGQGIDLPASCRTRQPTPPPLPCSRILPPL